MSIDLNKLIARKKYLVPVKSSDLWQATLKQLNIADMWVVRRWHPRSATFCLDYKEKYARHTLAQEGKPRTDENIAAKKAEYETAPIRRITMMQETMTNNTPEELHYVISEERADSCTVNAICRPMLYYKIVRQIHYEISDLQDTKLRSEEFLDEIFVGGLGSKEIQEVKTETPWELLINDARNRQIQERVYEMLKGATTSVFLMGWIGTDCIPKIKELKDANITIKAITHKPGEFKSPVPQELQKGYAELISLIGLDNVSTNPLLHGRALIVDNKVLVGSMDFNAHSLSGEHIEFAIYTEDAGTVRKLRDYFETAFKPLKE
jgi:hypothetical protein